MGYNKPPEIIIRPEKPTPAPPDKIYRLEEICKIFAIPISIIKGNSCKSKE